MSIPRIIHYCWFGKSSLPKSAIKCIESWKSYFPDFEIMEWNESNYDIRKVPYTAEAYAAKKYAFVSDYARFDILYQYGGVYFDTDVEVIKSFDDVLSKGPFMGCEIDPSEEHNVKNIAVAPGLGMAANKGMTVYKDIVDYYSDIHFLNADGSYNEETVVRHVTKVLLSRGLKNTCGIQQIADICIYPKEFFNPLNDNTGKMDITQNTHSIHWYTKTWQSPKLHVKNRITRILHRYFGEDCLKKRSRDWLRKVK